jgi:hypothetical protein
MSDLTLCTRFIEIDEQGLERTIVACLLVYDEPFFSDEKLSNDLREALDEQPTLDRIYVAAPLVPREELTKAIESGSAMLRVSEWSGAKGAFLRIITAERPLEAEKVQLFENYFDTDVTSGLEILRKANLPDVACQGWLFDLFVKCKAMVLAPAGVHFGKTSGKHSDRFLRTANVLTSSAACRLIAFFCLPLIPARKFRQIYVDTLPLVALGMALAEVGKVLELGISSGMIRSFGSYSGLQGSQEYRSSDLILVSASTSGTLVDGLIAHGADLAAVITLYYLQAKTWPHTKGEVLCDLTYNEGRLFGYAEVLSHRHASCPLCAAGLMLAEFEGDQFLLQRRRTKRLKIVALSQTKASRDFFEIATRKRAISVGLVGPGRNKYSDISFDVVKLLESTDDVRAAATFRLRRAVPTPLDFVVADDIEIAELSSWTQQNGKLTIEPTTPLLRSSALDSAEPQFEGGALVYFSELHNDFKARSINRALRRAAPRGCVTYFVVVLMCESPEARRDLVTFLEYGERGPKTFAVESVYELLLHQRNERSPWDLERDWIANIVQDEQSAPELQMRLNFLLENSTAVDDIFLQGQSGALAINDDFVYLNTKNEREGISQADIYAVASNLLSACRNDNRSVASPVPRGSEGVVWASSVYGQVLLCPRNFKDYNDGVLHAALLRGATAHELCYETDETLSEEVLEVILDEIGNWRSGGGQALAEFCLAIATQRMRLKATHLEEYKQALTVAEHVPRWIKLIAGIPVGLSAA